MAQNGHTPPYIYHSFFEKRGITSFFGKIFSKSQHVVKNYHMAALSLSLSKLAKLVEVLQKLSKRMYAITHTHRNGNNSDIAAGSKF